jgi:hypothetical protein
LGFLRALLGVTRQDKSTNEATGETLKVNSLNDIMTLLVNTEPVGLTILRT